jgi:glycosyltransferase involved in cell wall biosynthesis
MLHNAAKVICVSNLLEEAVILNFEGVNTCVIPNLVPAQYFEQKLEINTDDHAFTFGVIGALDSRKRVNKILEAFQLLKSEFPKVHLKIAGDGKEMKEIQNNIRSLDLAENIEIIGWLSRDEVPSFYKSIDCLLSASELETFGLTLIEANAFGKPFISTETGAADEILSNNNGLLCTPFSKENFAECMKNIMLSRASYNAIEIRETARREFHEYRIAQEIANLYNRVL